MLPAEQVVFDWHQSFIILDTAEGSKYFLLHGCSIISARNLKID